VKAVDPAGTVALLPPVKKTAQAVHAGRAVLVGGGLGVWVMVGVRVTVGVGVDVAVAVEVRVGVGVDVEVDVGVRVAVGVEVLVGVGVRVAVGVDVFVAVGVRVSVGVAVGQRTVSLTLACPAHSPMTPLAVLVICVPSGTPGFTVTEKLTVLDWPPARKPIHSMRFCKAL